MSAISANMSSVPLLSSSSWVSLYHEVCKQCDAARTAVLTAQQDVHDAFLPRLDRANAATDRCEVTLRGLLSTLRRTTAPAAESVSPEPLPTLSHSTDTDMDAAPCMKDAQDMRHATNSAQRMEELEERLAALTRRVEMHEKTSEREAARQRRALQQVRQGVAQMEKAKDELLVVLRQLQADKVALLKACTAEVYQDTSSSLSTSSPHPFPQRQSTTTGGNGNAVQRQLADSEDASEAAAALTSLEASVQGMALLLRQEREARAAEVQELAATLMRLERLYEGREEPPSSPRLGRHARAAVPDAISVDDTSRRLRYPSGVVHTPASAARRPSATAASPRGSLAGSARNQSIAVRARRAVVLRDRLLRFYAVYDPRMIPAVAEVVEQFKGPEEELMAALEMDYGAYGYFSRDG